MRFTFILSFMFMFACVFLFTLNKSGYTGKPCAGKWVIAMKGFCGEGMVKDAKEEMSAGKSDFDQFCKKVGKKRAVDARCRNNNLEVKCK